VNWYRIFANKSNNNRGNEKKSIIGGEKKGDILVGGERVGRGVG
jgi:hypothetical protein